MTPVATTAVADHDGPVTANHFDEAVAAACDADVASMFEPDVLDPTLDFLAALAGDRPALELAVGTGRVALPLSRRGVRVAGIELSEAMVDRLRAKPGGDAIPVSLGDMTTTRVEGSFGLVYLVFNTISNLLTQDVQVDSFRNAAAHLEPGGSFVVEVTIPALQAAPARRDAPGLPPRRGLPRLRQVRRRDPADVLSPHQVRRLDVPPRLDAVPPCPAGHGRLHLPRVGLAVPA
jgi:hypothetical protein